MATTSSSYVVPDSYKYDVFISFRGEDTRKNFTSHLYAALCRNQIDTYIDEKSLERGEEISPALLTAIEESCISIIVFSMDYASSTWCLDELVHILKCKQERGQTVLPVFYGVNPSDVRKQKGSYGVAFAAHEKRFEHNMSKVEGWKDALTDATNLSGFDSRDEYESKLIEKIVEHVMRILDRQPLKSAVFFKGLVGIEPHLKEIESLLCFGSQNIRRIGLWGMGGIGKTTLARAAFNQFSSRFEGCCFLANVREESQKHGLTNLKAVLFSELFDRGNSKVNYFVENKLRKKKVLIVLDDVDNIAQLEGLAGDDNWFGEGSKILITTRDAQLLKRDVDSIYEVEALDFEEALEVFYLNAFKRKPSETRFVELSKEITKFTNGNPLALKVLGSFLHSRTTGEWESALKRLKLSPHPDIQKVLKISYDGLHDTDQDILLDIACFLKGETREFVESILDDSNLSAKIGVEVLADKSLVTIAYDGTIEMHNLIQEMCWEIVRQQSIKEPGKRSRLWIPQDVCHVLENDKGTEAIEGICLDMCKMNEDLHLRSTVFGEMCNLRFLKIYYPESCNHNKIIVNFTQKLQFPRSLRYLCWYNYPSKSLPLEFKPHNLVQLDMPHSQRKQFPNVVQILENLKHINLSYSKQLVKLPDLSRALKLESINLMGCRSLLEVPPLNSQRYLEFVELKGCSLIKSLPKISGNIKSLGVSGTAITELPSSIGSFENLVQLSISCCQHIKNLPTLPRNIEYLHVGGTSIQQVSSSSIEGLHRLTCFFLSHCQKLESLPTNIFKLKSLQELNLEGCSRLKKFTKAPSNLKETRIQVLSNSFMVEKLFGLCREDMNWRKKLQFVPNWVYNLSSLKFLSHHDCSKLEHLRIRLFPLIPISSLTLDGCNIVEIPEWLGILSSLTGLSLTGNPFEKLPSSIIQLHRLEILDIRDCRKLRSLPQLPLSINWLDASGCTSLETLSSSGSKFTLRHLTEDFRPETNKQFKFTKCWKLERNERSDLSNIFYSLKKSTSASLRFYLGFYGSRFEVCYPGNEIPKWFGHRAEGDSISMKLPNDWNNSNFVCFAICFVAPLIPAGFKYSSECKWLYFYFDVHLKNKSGQIHEDCAPCTPFSIDSNEWITNEEVEEAKITSSGTSSEHVFICCWRHNSREYRDAIVASFYVNHAAWVDGHYEQLRCGHMAKRIGVGLVYEKEEKE